MNFAVLLALIFFLGLVGRRATRGTYVIIGLAAIAISIYEYLS